MINLTDAKITQVQSKGAKRNNEGEIVQEPYASVTLNVPLDSEEQRKGVLSYLELLREEWVVLEISTKQGKLPLSGAGRIPEEDKQGNEELFDGNKEE